MYFYQMWSDSARDFYSRHHVMLLPSNAIKLMWFSFYHLLSADLQVWMSAVYYVTVTCIYCRHARGMAYTSDDLSSHLTCIHVYIHGSEQLDDTLAIYTQYHYTSVWYFVYCHLSCIASLFHTASSIVLGIMSCLLLCFLILCCFNYMVFQILLHLYGNLGSSCLSCIAYFTSLHLYSIGELVIFAALLLYFAFLHLFCIWYLVFFITALLFLLCSISMVLGILSHLLP